MSDLDLFDDEPGPEEYGQGAFSPRLRAVLARLPTRQERPGLRVRICNALGNAKIRTHAQLLAARGEGMRRWRDMGPTYRDALEAALDGDPSQFTRFVRALPDSKLQELFEAAEAEILRRADLPVPR